MFLLIVDFEGEKEYGVYSTYELAKAEVDKLIEQSTSNDSLGGRYGLSTSPFKYTVCAAVHTWEHIPETFSIQPIVLDQHIVD